MRSAAIDGRDRQVERALKMERVAHSARYVFRMAVIRQGGVSWVVNSSEESPEGGSVRAR